MSDPELVGSVLPRVLGPGLYLDVPEHEYHSDPCAEPSLSVSIAQALTLESPAHAYLRHPRLGGQPCVPTTDMDRGTLLHALLLGKGREVAVVECDDWKKPGNRDLRDQHRSAGRIAVTRKLYDASIEAAGILSEKLKLRGFGFGGDSEVSFVWSEMSTTGREVKCRARLDHLDGSQIIDLKITGDANPRTLTRGHLTRMGYDIQAAVYPRALADVDRRLAGRVTMTLLFCEPEPPYCITAVRCAGSLKELGERKWERAKALWSRCLETGTWPDYTDDIVFAEAKPWELEDEFLESAAQ